MEFVSVNKCSVSLSIIVDEQLILSINVSNLKYINLQNQEIDEINI